MARVLEFYGERKTGSLIEISWLKKRRKASIVDPLSKNLRLFDFTIFSIYSNPFEVFSEWRYSDSTVRTCLHSLEEASWRQVSRGYACSCTSDPGGVVYCVEVAESRVISNNTITRNNRVYRTRPAYASGSITFIFHRCVLPRTRLFCTRRGEDWYTLDGSDSYVTGNRSDFHPSNSIRNCNLSLVDIYIYRELRTKLSMLIELFLLLA